MEIQVRLTQYDLTANTSLVLAEGVGHLLGNTLSYHEKDRPDVRQEVVFAADRVVLRRRADISSETTLILNQQSTSVVASSYGEMELTTFLEDCYHSEDMWMVEYRICSGSQEVTHQRLVWQLRGIAGS